MTLLPYSLVSVCIASIGRASLFSLVEDLYTFSSGGFDFHICIPEHAYTEVSSNFAAISCVNLYSSTVSNQVIQRQIAVKYSTREIALIIDDDISISKESIDILISSFLKLPNNSILAPVLCKPDGSSYFVDRCESGRSLFQQFKSFLVNIIIGLPYPNYKSYHMFGRLTKAGIPYPFLRVNDSTQRLFEVDYVPGCCFLIDSKGAKIDNYYPYTKGRCSLEDLFHCLYLSRVHHYSIYTHSCSFVSVEVPSSSIADILVLKNLTLSLFRQLRFNSTYGYSMFRFLSFYIINLIYLSFRITCNSLLANLPLHQPSSSDSF
ncbi:hypothetical protein [Synechococcus sp. UW140]|uniref:hypothetical protein n=1 Tax=Synechococcus sp. UW140 TaxID=368503 RepID=UPI00313835AD